MRKSRQETAITRKRIVKAASEEIRRNGIENTGLAEVMSAAGMAQGGFYKHFESKEQVVAESIASGIDSMLELWSKSFSTAKPGQGLQNTITWYLAPAHRDNPANGCPFAALASDVARGGDIVRATTTKGFSKMVDLIADQLPTASRAAAKKEALWIFSSMIGAVVMARVVDDPTISDAILRETRKHLFALGA